MKDIPGSSDTVLKEIAETYGMKQPQSSHWMTSLLLCLTLAQGSICAAQTLRLDPPPEAMENQFPQPTLQDPSANLPQVKLQAEMQGMGKATIFRQLQPQRYLQYENKSKALKSSLQQALDYIDSLENKPPSLQRLSAYSAEAWLDWTTMEALISPEEKQFASYRLMKEAVTELRSLSQYWITAERGRRLFRGTQREIETDQAILAAKRKKIANTLKELETFEKLKHELKAETAY